VAISINELKTVQKEVIMAFLKVYAQQRKPDRIAELRRFNPGPS
jgi:hypothetical protein